MRKTALPNKITHPNIIVCEGIDAKNFMMYFLQALIASDAKYETFEVVDGGGNDDLALFMKSLPRLSGFSETKTITLIRDAETNAADAAKSVQSVFRNAGFAAPDSPCTPCIPKSGPMRQITGYALFPGISETSGKGALEDLCLKILAEERRAGYLHIVENALAATERQFGKLKRPHKNTLNAYLSLTDKYVTMKLGESAKAGAFNFNAVELRPLIQFLEAMPAAASRRNEGS